MKKKVTSWEIHAFSASIQIQQIKCLRPHTIHWGLNLVTLLRTQKNAHIPENSPDVSSSVLDPGERELGELGPRRGQWTKRNTLIEPTAHEGPPPAKPSSTPKLRSAKGMCTPKVPGRYYNPRRR